MEFLDASSKLIAISASYTDDFNISINTTSTKIENNMDIHFVDGLSGIKDAKINNYSALYLTREMLADDIMSFRNISDDFREVIPTYLASNAAAGITPQSTYVHIDPYSSTDNNLYTSYSVRLSSEASSINNIFFEVELINHEYCRIYHRDEHNKFYLTVNNSHELYFDQNAVSLSDYSLSAIQSNLFLYILDRDNGRLAIMTTLSSTSNTLSAQNDTRIVAISGNKLALLPPLSSISNSFDSSRNFTIRYNKQTIEPKLNTSWVSYDVTQDYNSINIDKDKSSFNLKNNYLMSTQYTDISSGCVYSILNLKNQISEKNYQLRGDHMNISSDFDTPPVEMRRYESIHTGNYQERGDDSITLNYSFYNADYVFKTDGFTSFRTPRSMYPYSKININDTLFVRNGSLGGDTPWTSDRIYNKRDQDNGSPRDGQYLCTWLSASDMNGKGLWVDRYYNPKKATFIDALTSNSVPTYDYSDPIECIISNNVDLSTHLENFDYFDKISEMVFEPDTEYIYQRIGNQYVKDFLVHLEDNIFLDGLNLQTANKGSIDFDEAPDDQIYNFNNNSFAISRGYDSINENSQYTISFWLETDDWNQPFGHQIVGNLTHQGFGVINDGKITPFVMVQSDTTLYVFNTDFVLVDTIDVEETITDVIRTEHMDLFYVLSDQNNLFKIQSNGVVFDKTPIPEVAGYINFCNTENNIYFLMDTEGTIKDLNITFESISSTSVSGVNTAKSIAIDNYGNLQTFYGEKVINYSDDQVMYIKNNDVLVKEGYDHLSRSIMLSASSEIRDFIIDQDDNFYVIHNTDRITKFSANRDVVYQISLSGVPALSSVLAESISVDIVREFTPQGIKQYPIILSHNITNNELYLTKINESTLRPEGSKKLAGGINGEFVHACEPAPAKQKKYNLTNYKYIKDRYKDTGKLHFSTKLNNLFNNRDELTETISFDISNFNAGAHHFVYRVDTQSGNITLFVDGVKKENIKIRAGKYRTQNIQNDCIMCGATSFHNCIVLSDYIKQPGYYFVDNLFARQFKIYNTSIDDIDVKYLTLNGVKIDDLNVSLPCGERNQLEKIDRFFKWGLPGNKSLHIKLHIKNDVFNNANINKKLKSRILKDIKSFTPIGVEVDDVVFEKFV